MKSSSLKIGLMSLTFYLLLSLLFLFFFTSLYDTKPHVQTFTDRHDVVIGSLNPDFKGFQIWTHFSDISPEFVAKTIQKEDSFFYWHQGVNPWALLKALGSHLVNTGVRRGGSTITQQLAKNLIQEKLCQENECRPLPRNIPQKIKETVLALGLEMKHSKKWILERYLNTIYYGNHCYGVGAASQYYFPKHLKNSRLPKLTA
ncbi:MAG: transglycosylase domain-containing protein [Deltaproteobacteria bacterium]|nr:MAG: transglycosylase domain-containing protein [Deltaproteobacteria bacterium]